MNPSRRPLFLTVLLAQLFVMLALTLIVLACAVVARAVQPPLPSLLFTNRTTLHVRALGCTDVIGPCAPLDRPLLNDLDRTQGVSSWSPDGAYVAAHFSQGWLVYKADCLLDRGDCPGITLETDAGMSMRVAWGPDGSAIAYIIGGGNTLRVQLRGCLTGDRNACQTINFDSVYNMGQPAWSADGHYMAFSGAPHGFFMLDATCLGHLPTCELSGVAVDPDQYWWPSLSRNGHRLLYNTYSQRIYQKVFLLDLVTGATQDISGKREEAFAPAWDDSERYVAYVSPDGVGDDANLNIYVNDLTRGLTAPAVVLPGNDTFPSWVPPTRKIG